MFELYPESIVDTGYLVRMANALMYFMLVFSALHVYRLAHYHRTQVVISNESIVGLSLASVLFNLAGFNINWIGFSVAYGLVAWASWAWIPRKSLRWTNISIALFFLVTLLTYNLFNTKMQGVSYPFFATNDVIEYRFDYKPYFAIPWLPDDVLATVQFWIDGTKHEMTNEPVMLRIYLFYYAMHSFALIFWMLIFFDVLKKHGFSYERVSSKYYRAFFYSAPRRLAFLGIFSGRMADEAPPEA